LLGLFGPETLAIADPYLADEPVTNRICEQVRTGVEGLASWVAKAKPAACTPAIPSTAAGSRIEAHLPAKRKLHCKMCNLLHKG
jgi:hypothetical protein